MEIQRKCVYEYACHGMSEDLYATLTRDSNHANHDPRYLRCSSFLTFRRLHQEVKVNTDQVEFLFLCCARNEPEVKTGITPPGTALA